MPMHSMEAWPSHCATEGALGGRGGEERRTLPSCEHKVDRYGDFWRSFLGSSAVKGASPEQARCACNVCKRKLAASQVLSLNE